ncbi:tetratricopeptide repeat protein [Nonomuraea gerenzanensis]|uniref:Tetratricopeptide repeat family n=1 Tax=Nonomuraea gerenzanensis TaxID=93944 RepID=A0A1M4EB66_9ACTN|nr:tetratricopeptide repeat protein [Nonomuraea gerenzanensis]UBU18321.1 tetratricopeptide repeat protein [Nonomuraea gerenzanensis]SBO96145.1 Tetratricopeptide repeat family [Nonomuraea gerenzanensis]
MSNQSVTVTAGVGYGVIGADLHVFGDGSPLYLLENWRPPAPADSGALREQPSRMLNARHAVVEFTGREEERRELLGWRDGTKKLGVRWLHGPGGQGKSRLAARLAEESLAQGWKVVAALHGPGTVLPADRQEDLSLTGATGLLLVVDYADQWPLTHLTWLFSNALLHRPGVRTRVLLVARTLDAWPAVRATLATHLAATSAQALPALDTGGEREEMFRVARDSFARHYTVAEPEAVRVPWLGAPDMGLTLGVHMAALVAVDAFATGARQPRPTDLAALAAYLLDREHLHWARLHSEETHRLSPAGRTFTTTPQAMHYTVFLAALTGSVDRATGRALLQDPPVELEAERALADHAHCYPPERPGSVLEPLYPDRLAEDFLALTVSGHPVDYPAQPWAAPATATLVRRPGEWTDDRRLLPPQEQAPPWTPRAVTFLAAAAARWPHVGPNCLFPLLREDPFLALDAGNAALVALAESADFGLLESLAKRLPAEQNADVDVGAAAVVKRVTDERLAVVDDPGLRAEFLTYLAQRLSFAGRTEEALEPIGEALEIHRRLAEPSKLAGTLDLLGVALEALGEQEQALARTAEAVEIYRQVAEPAQPGHLAAFAVALHNAARLYLAVGDPRRAFEHAEEALGLDIRLAGAHPGEHVASVAASLSMVATTLSAMGRHEEALRFVEQAAQILTALAEVDPATHLPELADVQNNRGVILSHLGRRTDAVTPVMEAVAAERRLAEANPDVHLPGLALALNNLGTRHTELGEFAEALAAAEESVRIHTRLAAANPAAHRPGLAMSLHNLSSTQLLMGMARQDEERMRLGIENERRALEIQRELAAAQPARYNLDLAGQLMAFGLKLSQVGRPADGLEPTQEALLILRDLAVADPDAHGGSLALALHTFALVRAGAAVDLERARAAFEAAFGLWRALEEQEPGTHLAQLASGLIGYAATRATSGITTEQALAAAEEAIQLYDRILEAAPDDRMQAVARWGACHLLAELLAEAGLGAEAAELRARLTEEEARAAEPFVQP